MNTINNSAWGSILWNMLDMVFRSSFHDQLYQQSRMGWIEHFTLVYGGKSLYSGHNDWYFNIIYHYDPCVVTLFNEYTQYPTTFPYLKHGAGAPFARTVREYYPYVHAIGSILTFLFVKTALANFDPYIQIAPILGYHYEAKYFLRELTYTKQVVEWTEFININSSATYLNYMHFVDKIPGFVGIQSFFTWDACLFNFYYFQRTKWLLSDRSLTEYIQTTYSYSSSHWLAYFPQFFFRRLWYYEPGTFWKNFWDSWYFFGTREYYALYIDLWERWPVKHFYKKYINIHLNLPLLSLLSHSNQSYFQDSIVFTSLLKIFLPFFQFFKWVCYTCGFNFEPHDILICLIKFILHVDMFLVNFLVYYYFFWVDFYYLVCYICIILKLYLFI